MYTTDTLEKKVLAFFNQNSDEELTIRDAMVKFEVRQPRASVVIGGLVKKGILTVRREKQPPKQWIHVYSVAK